MTRLHLLVLLVVACVCYSALPVNGEAIELTSDDFFTSVNSGTWFVKFYAPWCPHCKSLAPTWDELATKATGFKVAKVDCEAEPGICQALSVKGFPTLFLFSGPKASKDNLDARAQKYSGAREVDAFLAFVKDNAKASDGDDDEESSTVTKQDKKTDAPAAATTKSSSEAITDPVSVPAIDLTNANFSETKKGAWFVEFYAPWCGYCKKLAPVYSEFAVLENAKGDFKVAKVNCDEEKAICGSVGVTAFPTLKFIVNGKTHDHVGAQTVKDMGTFARGILEDTSAEASGSDVVVLTNNNFERKVMSSDGAWLIDFYAPWCGHCKDVAPIWEEFAKTTKDNGDDINVAKIDCDANEALCERFNVQGYPTIKLLQLRTFPASKTRDLANFQKFWEKYEGVFTDPSASDVVILNADNFKQRTKHGLWLVDYYAPWCGHCKQLAPVLEEVATAQKGNFYVGKVDCEGPGNERLCETITGYPTLIAYQDGKKLANFQNAERSAQVIVDWMESFEEEVSEEDEELTDVAVLTDENFKRRTSEGNWLIEFYAPWCGHCKQLAPLWEELAIIENPTERVRVAKIDCTRYSAVCEKHKVDSFPAITFFKDGKEKKPRFSGERSLPKLREYVDKFVPRPAENFDSKDIL